MTKFLDPLDSAFILLETPGTSMNIGAVIELEVGEVTDPRERFELIERSIAATSAILSTAAGMNAWPPKPGTTLMTST